MSDNIGALWLKDGKKGKFFSGSIELEGIKTQIVVFKNTKKTKENHPDYNILLSKPRQEETETKPEQGEDDEPPF